jgi:hypothetical protein
MNCRSKPAFGELIVILYVEVLGCVVNDSDPFYYKEEVSYCCYASSRIYNEKLDISNNKNVF